MAVAQMQQSAAQQLDVAADEEEVATGPLRVEEHEVSAFWQQMLSCVPPVASAVLTLASFIRVQVSTATTWQN